MYRAHLFGRVKGAIGLFYEIETTVEADSPEHAARRLYERYEHLSGVTIREHNTGQKEPTDHEQP